MSTDTMTMAPALELLNGSRFGLTADAHTHPGTGPELPPAVLAAFEGVDAIIALGDMGEAAGLDALQAIAPVLAVYGADDDAGNPRVAGECRIFGHGKRLIGAVFDGARHGLFTGNDPFAVKPDFVAAVSTYFGRPVDVVLCAASHEPLVAWSDGILIVNPGSPTLAERCSVAILHLATDHLTVAHVAI